MNGALCGAPFFVVYPVVTVRCALAAGVVSRVVAATAGGRGRAEPGVHDGAGVAAVYRPVGAVPFELLFEGALGGTLVEPGPDLGVALVVAVAEHARLRQTIVYLIEDLRRLECLERVDLGLARRDGVGPARGVVLAPGRNRAVAVELRVLVPVLAEADVRAVREQHHLAIAALDHDHVVVVVEVVVPDPQDPIDALLRVDCVPVEVVGGELLEVRLVQRVGDDLGGLVDARVRALAHLTFVRDPADHVGREIADAFPHVGAAAAELVGVRVAPVALVRLDGGVGDHGPLGPLVAHQPIEAGPRSGVAEFAEDLERDRLAEDRADLPVVEPHVLGPVQGQVVLRFVHVDGEVGDRRLLPRHAGRLTGDVELDRSVGRDVARREVVGVQAGRAVHDNEVVGQRDVGVVADFVEVAAPPPGLVLPVVVGLRHDGRVHGEVQDVAVGVPDIDGHVLAEDRGLGRAAVVVDGVGVVRGPRVRRDRVVRAVLVGYVGDGSAAAGSEKKRCEEDRAEHCFS